MIDADAGTIASQRASGAVLNLTFDDGPDRIWTPMMLRQLARCGVTATFFMVGERVLEEPGIVGSVKAAGHEIQLHCHRHIRHSELTEAELQQDSETALGALASLGVQPSLWRAPWGICTEASRQVAGRLGLQLVGWTIDTHDWRGDRPEAMFEDIAPLIAGGGSVLMHDALGPGSRRAGCQNTLDLVAKLSGAARAQGLALTAMGPERNSAGSAHNAVGATA